MKLERRRGSRRQYARETLMALGLEKSSLRRRFWWESFLIGGFVTAAVLAISAGLLLDWPEQLLNGLSIVIALTVFAFSYIQWRAGRHEISFDTYYDKLEQANKWYNDWQIELRKGNPEELQDHLKHMFIFAELDKLEYVLEKYKLGYVRKDLVERALRAFRSRCESSADFRHSVHKLMEDQEDQERFISYHRSTRHAVRHILTQVALVEESRPAQ